ncbi:MAG: MBL fold metallo-hydrolase [Geminicoccaceae bacterium]|nr:MBL fold metallo-hydrolase [Geminicoccaceae bacterium]
MGDSTILEARILDGFAETALGRSPVAAGSGTAIAIRPEVLSLAPEPGSTPVGRMRVEERVFQGSFARLAGRVGATRLLLKVPPDAARWPGSEAPLFLRPGGDRRAGGVVTITERDWYETIPFADGITLVHESWMTPFDRCKCWHVRGRDRDLPVDAGLGFVPLRRNVPLLCERPIVLLSSHAHFDDIGSAAEFEERLVLPAEAAVLERPEPAAALFEHYASGERDDAMFFEPPVGWDPCSYPLAPAPATGLVVDGQPIDLGDRVFRVIHTPGHSPGHLALFEERTGVLIAQDILYDGPLVTDCPGADLSAYRASARRLLELAPRIVHGGHFASFGPTRLRQLAHAFLAAAEAGG